MYVCQKMSAYARDFDETKYIWIKKDNKSATWNDKLNLEI